jgi:transposase
MLGRVAIGCLWSIRELRTKPRSSGRVECWAHGRRYFHEAIEERPKAAHTILRVISTLYRLEAEWDKAGVLQNRADLRRIHFARPLYWLRRIVEGLGKQALPQSRSGKLCSYLLSNWSVLAAHQNYAYTRIDNNLVENAIRLSAIGKKNWLFIGHPDAGQRLAIIYSIVASCKRRGIEPIQYLRDVLQRLPSMTNRDDLTPLTPSAWQPS